MEEHHPGAGRHFIHFCRPRMASSSRIILERDANLMTFSSSPFLQVVQLDLEQKQLRIVTCLEPDLHCVPRLLYRVNRRDRVEMHGIDRHLMAASAASFMASHASTAGSDFLSSSTYGLMRRQKMNGQISAITWALLQAP